MVKIAFHDNQLCERGTTISLYDYAYYNRTILGNESIILYDGKDKRNVDKVIDKFKKEFKLFPYTNWNEVDKILQQEKVNIIYLQKAGEWDGKMARAKNIKNIIHCVFNTSFPHGNVYGRISGCFGNKAFPVVNYMVNLPNLNTDMRIELNIPVEAVVYGRHGGMTQFDIKYVYPVIDKLTDENKKVYFIFVNTDVFCKRKDNIIHLDKIIDLNEKTRFINSCDAMIHARVMGETFGAAVSEFSVRNKPIITCRIGDIEHLHILKNKCFIYNDATSLLTIFNYFNNNIKDIRSKDWNCYSQYTPENIMNDFNEKFIKPCL
jgi:hypothetical protein